MNTERLGLVAVLIVLGAGWGVTIPLTKIVVSTGYQHFGLLFWQLALGAASMTLVGFARGLRLRFGWPQMQVYVIIALIGSIFPGIATYQAAVHLPAGVMSILLSMVPIWAFPIALALSLDRFEWRRFAGLLVGVSAVVMIVLPDADMSGALPVLWVVVALVGGLFYGFEGNYVARWGTAGLSPVEVLWGASLIGAIIVLPFALWTGQWINPVVPWGAPEGAHVFNAVIHVVVYTGYVWLVGRAGPVFAIQVSFLVTLFGMFWARLILVEDYAPTVWIALILMLGGMYLVQPRRPRLEASRPIGDT